MLETARAQIKKKNHGALAGTIAWAWGGEGRPPADGSSWKMGDDFTGDPPSEAQGANSIFDTDISTLEGEQETAQETRDTTNEAYKTRESLLSQAIAALENAIDALQASKGEMTDSAVRERHG